VTKEYVENIQDAARAAHSNDEPDEIYAPTLLLCGIGQNREGKQVKLLIRLHR
jgi:hypothetical protein